MRYLLFIFVCFSSISMSYSQLKWGVVGAYSLANSNQDVAVLGDDLGRKVSEVAFVSQVSQPSIGLGLSADFGPLYAAGAAQYRRSGYVMNIKRYSGIDVPSEDVEFTVTTLHMPITGGVKLGAVRVGVGPVFNWRMSPVQEMKDDMLSVKERALQTAFLFVVGYDVTDNIRLGARYEYAFDRVGDRYSYRGKRLPIDSRMDYISFTAGYYF